VADDSLQCRWYAISVHCARSLSTSSRGSLCVEVGLLLLIRMHGGSWLWWLYHRHLLRIC
jgi:hypothetical protein